VTGSSLTVSASTDGDLEAKGKVDAQIERLGQGSLEAKVGTGHGLWLDGNFKFTSDFFKKADVALDRKILADIAVRDASTFGRITEIAKTA